MKRRNIIAVASAVVLSTILLIGGSTLAASGGTEPATDESSSLSFNTVSLVETAGAPQLDGSGNITNAAFEIIPGTSQEKDPTVSVSYTQNSYVFVEVEDSSNGLLIWAPADGWLLLSRTDNEDESGNVISTTYVYYRLVTGEDSGDDFTSNTTDGVTYYTNRFSVLEGDCVSYSSSITNEDIVTVADDGTLTFTAANIELTFQAYLAQIEGTKDAANAWLAASGKAAVLNETTGVAYATLEEAISEVTDTATISLMSDVSTEESLSVGSDVSLTIDLNGHTLTPNTSKTATVQFDSNGEKGKATGFLVSPGGFLIITDSSDSSGKLAASDLDYAVYLWNSLTLKNGTIEGLIALQSSSASLTISGGTLDNTAAASSSAVNLQQGSITMTGGVVKGYIGFFVSAKGSVTMSGGTIEATNIGIYTAGSTTVSGGTISAGRGIVCGGGTLSISDGTVDGTTYFLQSNGSGAKMSVSGGIFSGDLDIQRDSGTLIVTGGTYSVDPTSYVDLSSYTVTWNSDGTYTVAAQGS